MNRKKATASSLRQRLIESAPKDQKNRGWWVAIASEDLSEMREIWKERGIAGSEINRLYPSVTSLAKFFIKEFSLNVLPRCVVDHMKALCDE